MQHEKTPEFHPTLANRSTSCYTSVFHPVASRIEKMIAHNQKLQRLAGGTLERWGLNVISTVQLFLLGCHKDKQAVRLVRKTRSERRSLMNAYEAYTVYSLAKAYRDLPGDMAEVGVFQGASAKLICEVKGDARLHLFDTFEGLPKASKSDGRVHDENQYHCSLDSVKEYLAAYGNVFFHKGRFPDSTADMEERRFSLVHMDVDLYESTLACLQYFYPRMLGGGVMISHDYSLLAGVSKAFTEFFAGKTEKPIELPSTQCMVIKLH
jgi:O-methyltransferase